MSEAAPQYLMFKLASGSPFIIAEVIGESNHELITRFPLIFSFQDVGDGNVFVSASKFMHFAERDEVVFDKRNIYALATPKQTLLKYYIDWRASAPAGAFEHVEEMMLESACDPTLDDSEYDLASMTPVTNTVH